MNVGNNNSARDIVDLGVSAALPTPNTKTKKSKKLRCPPPAPFNSTQKLDKSTRKNAPVNSEEIRHAASPSPGRSNATPHQKTSTMPPLMTPTQPQRMLIFVYFLLHSIPS
jgi:hypothetical protein